MSRPPRILPDDGHFHLIARSNNGTTLCRYADDYLALKKRIRKFCDRGGIEIYKYSLMKTHYHLLGFVPDSQVLATVMRALQVSYFHHYSRRYKYRGHLWHHRFRSIYIQTESHVFQGGRYIELNAVHAGIVSSPEKYRWSSYHFYAYGVEDFLITPNALFAVNSESQRVAYREFIHAGINHDYQRQKKEFEQEKAVCCKPTKAGPKSS